MKKKDIIKDGLFRRNPIFILLLGLCPTLAITFSVNNAIMMGISVIVVLFLTNLIVSSIRKIIPSEIRIPVYIVIIATLVSCITFLIQAFAYDLFISLGIFLPLMTVNCLIFGRAEAFASKNKVSDSLVDALASGGGFAAALLIISFIREFLGTGFIKIVNPFNTSQILISTQRMWNFFGGLIKPTNSTFISDFIANHAIRIFIEPIGAFIVLGVLVAGVNFIVDKRKLKKESVGVEV